MRRFFIDTGVVGDGTALLGGELYRHMVRVLRMREGDRLVLADGNGMEYLGVIAAITGEQVMVRVEESAPTVSRRTSPEITIMQGIPKGERMELILQKGTELGASGFVPLVTSRTVPRLPEAKAVERRRRWERIVAESARQSRSPLIPSVGAIVTLTDALASAGQELKLLLWEGEEERGLRNVLAEASRPVSVALLIGPEGGLSREEAGEAMAAGFIPVTLGGRILRTETAGLAVLSILQYLWGELG